MRFLIDENLSSPRLASRLRAQGHDPVLAGDVGLLSVTDARVLIYSIAEALSVLTQDSEDFEDLHDLGWLPAAIMLGFWSSGLTMTRVTI